MDQRATTALLAALIWVGACQRGEQNRVVAYAPLPKPQVGLAEPPAVAPAAASPLAQYEAAAARIMEASKGSHRAYDLLRHLCDNIGARLSGSEALERAHRWAAEHLEQDKHENVAIEKAMVPRWIRGEEALHVESPADLKGRPLTLLGLGGSVGTSKQGLIAPVMVVAGPEDLERRSQEAKGKIVLFNTVMPAYDEATRDPGYGKVVGVRVGGASLAAKHGAVAMLIRSLTHRSLVTPHTGFMRYGEGKKIPAAAVTVEDAEWLARMAQAKSQVSLRLRMGARDAGMAESGNVVAELRGRELPDEVVVIGAHSDSWDVGQGAHDDGAGMVVAMEALSTLRRLGLQPRRTVRVVLWTNEENGGMGAKQYAKDHADETHVAGIESDTGGAPVVQLSMKLKDGVDDTVARRQLTQILSLLAPLGVDRLGEGRFAGADLNPLIEQGMPGIGLIHDLSHYFDLHHTAADTLDKIDPDAVDQSVASMAILAYVLAEQPAVLK